MMVPPPGDAGPGPPPQHLAGDGESLPQPVGAQLQPDLLLLLILNLRLLRRHNHVQQNVTDASRSRGKVHPALV